MPIYAVPGNHDSSAIMRACLPDLVPARESAHASFVVDHLPVRIVGLDTTVAGAAHGALCSERMIWLTQKLSERPDLPVLVVMHHPPFVTGMEAMDRCGLLVGREQFVALIAEQGNVVGILCGHLHRTIHANIAGVPVHVASSTAHQFALNLSSGAPLEYCLEPACISLHGIFAERQMVSHTGFVESFPGPWRF